MQWKQFPIQSGKLEHNQFHVRTLQRNNTISPYIPLRKVDGEDRYAFLELLQYFIGEQTFETMLLVTRQDLNDSSSTTCFVTGSDIAHFKIEDGIPKCFIHVYYQRKHCMILNGFLLKPVHKEY